MRVELILLLFYFLPSFGLAGPNVGKGAAMKYFKPQSKALEREIRGSFKASNRLLALSAGRNFSGKSHQWAGDQVGGWNLQFGYRFKGKNSSLFSKAYQMDFQKLQFTKGEITKLSFLLNFIFPRSHSFPVYIGIGAGPGIFLSQKARESWLSVDYKGYFGFRLSDEHSQFFIEGGVKNQLLVLSNGQFSGWFISSGVAYQF